MNLDNLKALIEQRPDSVYRAKGIFNIGRTQHIAVMQKVGNRIDWSEHTGTQLASKHSSLIIIAKKESADFKQIKTSLDALTAAN